MIVRENVPLAPLTSLHVGGPARFFMEAKTEEDVQDAISFSRERSLALFALGKGSNLLVPDEGVDGVVMHISLSAVQVTDEGERIVVEAEGGALWDRIVEEVGALGAFGIENLAGIPGTIAGAAVQNAGAYGGEFSHSFTLAQCVSTKTGKRVSLGPEDAQFSYRTSVFKVRSELLITKIALTLSKHAEANLSYADLMRAKDEGAPLSTPLEIAAAVRAIRSRKFPKEGSAGSFFKNPTLPKEKAEALAERFPALPRYLQEDGTVKISLAWLLDRALHLKGYARGPVRLYENQPLVIVASSGARAQDVDALAREIEERALREWNITIEREVETFGARAS